VPRSQTLITTQPASGRNGSSQAAAHEVTPHLFLVMEAARPTAGGARASLSSIQDVVIGRAVGKVDPQGLAPGECTLREARQRRERGTRNRSCLHGGGKQASQRDQLGAACLATRLEEGGGAPLRAGPCQRQILRRRERVGAGIDVDRRRRQRDALARRRGVRHLERGNLAPRGEDGQQVCDSDARLRDSLLAALLEHKGNVTHVARAMGCTGMQVHRWMRRFQIDPAELRR
jgi:hypothetical protein